MDAEDVECLEVQEIGALEGCLVLRYTDGVYLMDMKKFRVTKMAEGVGNKEKKGLFAGEDSVIAEMDDQIIEHMIDHHTVEMLSSGL